MLDNYNTSKLISFIDIILMANRRIKMSRYDEGYNHLNQPAKKQFELVPMLIVALATLTIIVLQLIHNCGGV
jgi:hypothetical protein